MSNVQADEYEWSSVPVLHQAELPLLKGVLWRFVGAMSGGPRHPLWEAGAGVTQLAGGQVTCVAWGDTKQHVSQQDCVAAPICNSITKLVLEVRLNFLLGCNDDLRNVFA